MYHVDKKTVYDVYRAAASTPGLRAAVYNGDTDPGINVNYAQNFTAALGLPVAQEWRPWTLDGAQLMGGAVTRYEGAGGGVDFITIRGAGHMVPEYQPAAALELISRFLADEPLKPYVPPPGASAGGVDGPADHTRHHAEAYWRARRRDVRPGEEEL